MKKTLLTLLCFSSGFASYTQSSNIEHNGTSLLQASKQIKGFVENKGQLYNQDYQPNPSVLYKYEMNGINVLLKQNSFSYDTYEVVGEGESLVYNFHRVDIAFLGASKTPEIIAIDKSKEYDNFYNIPHNEEGVLNVHHYQKIIYKNLYDNIDLEFFVTNNPEKPFEYNFIVHPNGNLADIKMNMKGAPVAIENNKLVYSLAQGKMTEEIPASWYEDEINNKESINITYVQNGDNTFGLNLPENRQNKKLVIDPTPDRLWGTYYGGSSVDKVYNMWLDGEDIFIVGSTQSTSNIATGDAHQFSFGGGAANDAFYSKFNGSGGLVYSTYYGGSGTEDGFDITQDNNQNVYLCGQTTSTGNIATAGSFCDAFGTTIGSQDRAFFVKFNSAGVRVWGSYTCATGAFNAFSSVRVANGFLYCFGTTSTDGQATPGAHQEIRASGALNHILYKFDLNGNQVWSTYYGNHARHSWDIGLTSIEIDNTGNVYVGGVCSGTNATNYQTVGAHQSILGGGTHDVILGKFTPAGVLLWGTYYGGSEPEYFRNLFCDGQNNIYIVGESGSSNGISTPFAFQQAYGGSTMDGFIVKFNDAGTRVFGSYVGGTGLESYVFGAVDGIGNIYISGSVYPSFPHITANTWQSTSSGGWESWVMKMDPSFSVLQWGTHYGGASDEYMKGIAIDQFGKVLITGETTSITNIASAGAHQQFHPNSSSSAIFLAKLDNCPTAFATASSNSPVCVGDNIEFTATGGTSYSWSGPNGFTSTLENPIINNATTAMAGTYTLVATDDNNCVNTLNVSVVVNTLPTVSTVSNFAICAGTSVTLSGAGSAIIYNWDNSISDGVSFTPTISQTYTVIGTDANNCTNDAQVTITVNQLPNVSAGIDQTICSGAPITLAGSGATSYTWDNGVTNNVLFTPTQTNTYTVTGTDANNCQNTDDVIIIVLNSPIQEVCVVTVDEMLADHNIVVWEKPSNIGNIDSFYVYREISLNNYQIIGAKHISELSEFSDFGANPNSTSYKYKITTLDTCGNESDFGLFHKSIHLQYSGLGNFQWTFYDIENTPNQVASYNFWRDDIGNGNLQILQTVSGSSSSFTDIDYATYPNAIYRVDLNWIDGTVCTSTKANINTSRSNKKGAVIGVDGIAEELAKFVNLSPVPTNDILNVKVPATMVMHQLIVRDGLGKILSQQVITNETTNINVSAFATGVYFIQIPTEHGMVTKKFVKG